MRGLLWIHEAAGPRFVPIRGPASLGRDSSCDIVVDADQVSRKHLNVRCDGPLLVAEDAGSRNGSFADGMLFSRVGLQHGCVLRLGQAVAVVWDAPLSQDYLFREVAAGLLGGATLAHALADLPSIAKSSLPVVIEGPTGAGKERVARAVHDRSERSGRFVAINCAAIPEQLAEAHLFGHRRGAYTGATQSAVGYLQAADGGTLFLDEVLELPPSLQAKLLRTLQEGEFVPVGQVLPVPLDVRVVAATQVPLADRVSTGDFRLDFMARLNGYRFRLPALCERKEDVPFLFRHFLRQSLGDECPALGGRLIESLCLNPWLGNVRELQLLAQRTAVLHGDGSKLRLDDLPPEYSAHGEPQSDPTSGLVVSAQSGAAAAPFDEVVDDTEVHAVREALQQHCGNVLKAARQLGISRGRAYRLISAASLDLDALRRRSGPRRSSGVSTGKPS